MSWCEEAVARQLFELRVHGWRAMEREEKENLRRTGKQERSNTETAR